MRTAGDVDGKVSIQFFSGIMTDVVASVMLNLPVELRRHIVEVAGFEPDSGHWMHPQSCEHCGYLAANEDYEHEIWVDAGGHIKAACCIDCADELHKQARR